MIGQVTFDYVDGNATAVMEDNGQWSFPDDQGIEAWLNAFHDLRDYSPADGQPGYKQIAVVAKALNGKPTFPAPAKASDTVIY